MMADLLVKFTCGQCGSEFSVTVGQPELYNGRLYSSLVWTHPHIEMCPGCGANFVLTIQPRVQAAFGLLPLASNQTEQRIVLPV